MARYRSGDFRFSHVWTMYVESTERLLAPRQDDRPGDQFLQFRDDVMDLVVDERFLNDLDKAWGGFTREMVEMDERIPRALVSEMLAFTRAVDVAQSTEIETKEKRGWGKSMLRRSSTVAGSVKDLLGNLPPYAKNTIILFRELVALIRG